MKGEIDEKVREGPSWNYADVIALVTANLHDTHFNGDRSAWLRGLCELSEKYPQFFKGVHFTRRDPYAPFSLKADEVLKMLGRWEYKSDFNPSYRRIELSDDGKRDLKEWLEPKLSGHLGDIAEMAKILEGYVSLIKDKPIGDRGAGKSEIPDR